MAGTHAPAPDYDAGYRALLSSYRTRLFVAIIFVVAVVLGLVLVSLPRLLEGFFLDQEQANLRTRAQSMATVIANELADVAGGGALPLILGETLGASTELTLGDAGRGAVSEVQDVARADAHVALERPAGEVGNEVDVVGGGSNVR